MDFERAAIKTLFYDYPVETAMKELLSNNDSYMDIFSDITRWRNSAFTVSEWNLLKGVLRDEWLKSTPDRNEKPISHILNIIQPVCEKLLTIDSQREPRVEFDNLFRWRDIVLMTGEDMFTTAFLAKRDILTMESTPERKIFLWDRVLPHNNRQLNEILNRGLSDVHAHLYASYDVFHYKWIEMMNNSKDEFKTLQVERNEDLTFLQPSTSILYTHYSQCVAAAYLRTLLFTEIVLQTRVESKSWEEVKKILEEPMYAQRIISSVQGNILNLQNRDASQKVTFADYTIPYTIETAERANHVNIFYQGERNMLYQFFKKWYEQDTNIRRIAHYFYLYLLLKTRIRREYVETNVLHGFENFAAIQKHKQQILNQGISLDVGVLAVRSARREQVKEDKLEARIAPIDEEKLIEIVKKHYTDDAAEIAKNLSFTIHFLKQKEKFTEGTRRHDKYINKCFEHLYGIIKIARLQQREGGQYPQVVGIDAAGSELVCRPEVFGHLFRFAQQNNILGRTYHAGEDFYDLVDGLRSISEAILFLQLDAHSRIGHALALSVDAKQYYEKRHFSMVISRQALLDNCVWLYFKAKEYDYDLPGSLEVFLVNTALEQYNAINFSADFDMLTYWHSMLLRGDDEKDDNKSKIWQDTCRVKDAAVKSAHYDKIAERLNFEYQTQKLIKETGNKVTIAKYPRSIIKVIQFVQTNMIREIAEKGIAIECCPSSNVMIGGFERYDKHPIFTFKPIEAKPTDPIINVSINTDDAGIFATNISNEYSLITLAMMKMKDENGHRLYNDETIYNYIERVRANGMIQRFKVD
jgi:adenosine deaminase